MSIYSSYLQAEIHRVPQDHDFIQSGIEAAEAGDTVLIAPGFYPERINFDGKPIVVGSYFLLENDTSHISATVLDGGLGGSVVSFTSGEDSSARLIGLTLSGGSGTLRSYSGGKPFLYGGGVFVENSSPRLEHLRLVDNHSAGGGGIFLKNSAARIQHVDVRGNSANSPIWEAPNVGGGVLLWDSSPVIRAVDVSRNHCEDAGGGIYLLNSDPLCVNLTVTDNHSARWGGGVFCETNSQPLFINTTIVQNSAGDDGGGISLFNNAAVVLANTIVTHNVPEQISALPYQAPNTVTITHSNLEGGLAAIPAGEFLQVNWLAKNIDERPMFRNLDGGDYRLQAMSPCVDEGTVLLVIEKDTLWEAGKGEYSGSAPDLGRYEYHLSALKPGPPMRRAQPAMLAKNFPDPFNPSTRIGLHLAEAGKVTLKIFDILGREVQTLVDRRLAAGEYTVQWNGTNRSGAALPSGTYFYRLDWRSEAAGSARHFSQTRKMVLLK